MNTNSQILLSLGVLFALGLLCHELGKRTAIPRVSLLLLVGVLASAHVFDLVPPELVAQFPLISQFALCLVGFLIGEQFVYHSLQLSGRSIWIITFVQAITTATVVLIFLFLVGTPVVLAILLAGIAVTTAPTASLDVIKENHFKGELPNILLKVVAIDDVIGILLFSVCFSIAQLFNGHADIAYNLMHAIKEIILAIGLGVVLGWPMAKLTGRLNKGEPMLMEALAFILICGSIAQWMHASYILSCIVLGAMVANFAKHHERPFHAIEGISTPLLIVFFILAGYQFDVMHIQAIGLFGIAYILSRSIGKVGGGYIGAKLAHTDKHISSSLGWCLLPQAGIALGLALMAAHTFPEYASQLLSILVGSTMVFEIVGPLLARLHLNRNAN